MTIWYILFSFGTFWYRVRIKIWQPWSYQQQTVFERRFHCRQHICVQQWRESTSIKLFSCILRRRLPWCRWNLLAVDLIPRSGWPDKFCEKIAQKVVRPDFCQNQHITFIVEKIRPIWSPWPRRRGSFVGIRSDTSTNLPTYMNRKVLKQSQR
jgi:hypothetical protein